MDENGAMSAAKYFIAIVLPEPLLVQVEDIKQALFREYGLKGALRSPAHITLHRPFQWKEEKQNVLIEKLKQFVIQDAFYVQLQNFGFFEPRVVYVDVLKNENLFGLHSGLVKHVKRELNLLNEAEDLRGFYPHVTVAFRDLKKPLFYHLKERYTNEKLEGEFEFKSFSLLKLHDKWEVLQNFHI